MTIKWTDRSEPLHMPVLPAGVEQAEVAEVRIDPQAEAGVLAHLAGHDTEAGGLLLGEAYARRDDVTSVALIRVRAGIAAADSTGTAFSLAMGSSVWRDAQAALQPGWRIVGWYHSHPGLGAFFSGTDRRTQRAFFAHPWSIGWVIDPIRGEQAWFLGPDSEPIERVDPDR